MVEKLAWIPDICPKCYSEVGIESLDSGDPPEEDATVYEYRRFLKICHKVTLPDQKIAAAMFCTYKVVEVEFNSRGGIDSFILDSGHKVMLGFGQDGVFVRHIEKKEK